MQVRRLTLATQLSIGLDLPTVLTGTQGVTLRARRMLRWHARRLCSSSGVIASAWPRGLLQDAGGKRPTTIALPIAEELLYEVGWQSRHALLDVRRAEAFARGRPRGAVSVPYEDEDGTTFVERTDAVITQMVLERPAAHHLALASQPRGDGATRRPAAPMDEDDRRLSKLIVLGDDTSSLALTATAELLAAGFENTVALEAGFDEWSKRGLPCDALTSDDEVPDSTF